MSRIFTHTIITLMAPMLMLVGCQYTEFGKIRNAEQSIQGEWRLVSYSNSEMTPGKNYFKRMTYLPKENVFYVFRNGHLVIVQGSEIAVSTPYRITRHHDSFYDLTSQVLHFHLDGPCPERISVEDLMRLVRGEELDDRGPLTWHDSFRIIDGALYLSQWDEESKMGLQNAYTYKFVLAEVKNSTIEGEFQGYSSDD